MSLQLRDLAEDDLGRGFLELLGQLTVIGDPKSSKLAACVRTLVSLPDLYKIVVVEDIKEHKIVATARLLVEVKFQRDCEKVGHIEDVVVDAACRGKKLGQWVVQALVDHAIAVGCYKVILDCAEANAGFYEKCGLERKGVQLAKYLK